MGHLSDVIGARTALYGREREPHGITLMKSFKKPSPIADPNYESPQRTFQSKRHPRSGDSMTYYETEIKPRLIQTEEWQRLVREIAALQAQIAQREHARMQFEVRFISQWIGKDCR